MPPHRLDAIFSTEPNTEDFGPSTPHPALLVNPHLVANEKTAKTERLLLEEQ